MDFDQIKAYCLSKKGALEDRPFGPEPLVMKVANKMFALLSVNNGSIHISLKCDPVLAQNLRQEYPTIKPGYHLNKEHWNTVVVDGSVPESEIFWLIDLSYQLVFKGLPKQDKEAVERL